MKIKQKLLFLLPLLFLFTPLFSSAQFITTNAPCEPEIIPPHGQVGGVYCPYCANKGEFLHLKWDLKTNFQDPVCGISCWTPSGDQCANWPTGRLFDDKGKPKTNLKPKDDIFVKSPGTGPRTGPGINYQISCHEKKNPKLSQLSSGIRVVGGECGEPAVGEPCEVPFGEIANNLRVGLPAKITEANFKNWSTDPDLKDNSILSKGLGSGDKADVVKSMIEVQVCQRLPVNKDAYRYAEYDRLSGEINASLDNDIPIVIVLSFSHAVVALNYSQNVPYTNVSTGEQGFRDFITVFDPNYPGGVIEFTCRKERVYSLMRHFDILRCEYGASTFSIYKDFFVMLNPIQMYEPLDCGVDKRVRPSPTNWLMSNVDNLPAFENFAPGDGRLGKGLCFGYSDFVRNVACFGDFVGYDYHPGDGKIVGRDCGIDRYPIAKSVSRNSSLLSNIFVILSKYILD